MSEESKKREGVILQVEWNIPDDIVARYATNMLVQRGENEYYISFFETKPPVLLGTPEQINKKVEGIKSLQANCVAQVIIAAEKLPSFIEALQDMLKKTHELGNNEAEQ